MRPPAQRAWRYIEVFGVSLLIMLLFLTFVAQSYLVQGASMLPTLHDGERVVVDKLTYRFRRPLRGEIVVFRHPHDTRRNFIKRVVGVPGDTVEVRGWLVYINGEPLSEEYILGPTYNDYGPVTVPEGRLFVLGDNRNHSEDSRHQSVGLVPYDHVIGRAVLVYWPLKHFGPIVVPNALAQLE